MHHLFIRARQRYRVGFVPDPCWTVVPVSYQALARQRARWAQIMAEALWIHRGMLFNPRYGVMGLFILPCYLIFELGGAIVEVLGLAGFPAGLVLGIVAPGLAVLFILSGVGYATLLTIASVIIEEFSYNRYRSWRVRGIAHALLGRHAQWQPPEHKALPADAGAAGPLGSG